MPRIIGMRRRPRERTGPDDSRAVVVLGGGSDIGLAVAGALVDRGARTVVLAGRHPEEMRARAAARAALASHAHVETIAFDAQDFERHQTILEDAFALAGGEVGHVVVAFAVLGDARAFEVSSILAGGAATTNFAGAVSSMMAAARLLERQSRPATIIVLSSAAMVRPRLTNYVYGAAKAGLDFFARGMADAFRDRNVHVLIVRPGWVETKMTARLKRRPFATTPDAVAHDVMDALDAGDAICWSPGFIRWVALAVRLVPGWAWRRVR